MPASPSLIGVLFAVIVALVAGPATAQKAQDPIQQTIENQIQAFLADDAQTAYSFAAPSIKSIFPNSAAFMSMVKRGYLPVYRPQSYSFAKQAPYGNQMGQEVDIIGPNGGSWTAFYTLRQQVDGSWKITGVQLRKGPDLSV